MTVSVIIVNYNTYQYVLDCIKSVITATVELDYEIIVVDNNSPNRDIEGLINNYPDVKLVLNSLNSGFGSGNNLGVKHSVGRNIFFLNSDTLLQNNAIKILSDYLDNNNEIAVCGGNLYNINLKPATSFSRMQPGFLADVDYFFFNIFSKMVFKKNIFFNYTNTIIPIKGTISGADYMVKRSVFDSVGGFDEDFFMYYEETELSYRIMKKGFKIANVPEAKITHFEGASETLKERSLNWTLESKKKYFKKTSNLVMFYSSNMVFFCTILQRIFIFSLTGNHQKKQYWLSFYRWAVKQF